MSLKEKFNRTLESLFLHGVVEIYSLTTVTDANTGA
jgi:hypothetical protein